jgi:putative phosphoesterase
VLAIKKNLRVFVALRLKMKIGLLSDTHGSLDPRIIGHFSNCNEVWHAGDLGDRRVADELEAFKPLRAVFGNIDDKDLQLRYPEDLFFKCEEVSVWITHIGGAPPRYNPRIKKTLKDRQPDIFICGHSHVLLVARDPAYGGMLYLNPGAAGNQGFHQMKTILRFEISGKEIQNMEVIELGKRGLIG